MEKSSASPNDSFTSAMTHTEEGLTCVPKRYIFHHPYVPIEPCSTNTGFILTPTPSSSASVQLACKELGYFQVVNHGIPLSVMKDSATDFFNLPNEEKMHLLSPNVHGPVRYNTSLSDAENKISFWRDFLKHYANPISNWIDLWPSNPACYNTKKLQEKLMEIIFESLGLNPNYLHEDVAESSKVIAINFYPACPDPDLALGLPPHTDYSLLSIILQRALIALVGDHMEVLSNDRYKGVVHRATVNSEKKRLFIARLHSLALRGLSDFLDFISGEDIVEAKYIDKLKIDP
ncbi:unnamed protein product [Withania somnifera]